METAAAEKKKIHQIVERRHKMLHAGIFGRSVAVDWVVLIAVCLVLFVGLISWSVVQFIGISNQNYLNNQNALGNEGYVIDTEKLDAIAERYERKEERLTSLRSGELSEVEVFEAVDDEEIVEEELRE